MLHHREDIKALHRHNMSSDELSSTENAGDYNPSARLLSQLEAMSRSHFLSARRQQSSSSNGARSAPPHTHQHTANAWASVPQPTSGGQPTGSSGITTSDGSASESPNEAAEDALEAARDQERRNQHLSNVPVWAALESLDTISGGASSAQVRNAYWSEQDSRQTSGSTIEDLGPAVGDLSMAVDARQQPRTNRVRGVPRSLGASSGNSADPAPTETISDVSGVDSGKEADGWDSSENSATKGDDSQTHSDEVTTATTVGQTEIDRMMLLVQAHGRSASPPSTKSNSDVSKSPVLPKSANHHKRNENYSSNGNGSSMHTSSDSEYNFGCTYDGCGKRFKQRAYLHTHMRSHTGERPYVCPYDGCKKWFSQRCNLRTHIRSHTGERPYKCNMCGKAFSQQGNMRHHMLIHYNEHPLECKIDNCGKKFNQLGNLKSHQNAAHRSAVNEFTKKLQSGKVEDLPEEEQEMFDYFCELYKNSNRGIRGRGKGTKTIVYREDSRAGPDRNFPELMAEQNVFQVNPQASYLQTDYPQQSMVQLRTATEISDEASRLRASQAGMKVKPEYHDKPNNLSGLDRERLRQRQQQQQQAAFATAASQTAYPGYSQPIVPQSIPSQHLQPQHITVPSHIGPSMAQHMHMQQQMQMQNFSQGLPYQSQYADLTGNDFQGAQCTSYSFQFQHQQQQFAQQQQQHFQQHGQQSQPGPQHQPLQMHPQYYNYAPPSGDPSI